MPDKYCRKPYKTNSSKYETINLIKHAEDYTKNPNRQVDKKPNPIQQCTPQRGLTVCMSNPHYMNKKSLIIFFWFVEMKLKYKDIYNYNNLYTSFNQLNYTHLVSIWLYEQVVKGQCFYKNELFFKIKNMFRIYCI